MSGPDASESSLGFWGDVMRAIPDGLVILGPDYRLLEANDAFCRLVGFAREELVGKSPPFPYWPASEVPVHDHELARALRGECSEFEVVLVTKGGERTPVLLHSALLRDSQGNMRCLIATVKDMTERIRMEQALRRSEERWRSIVENPYDFVTTVDLSFRYTYVNHTAEGIREEDLLGKLGPLDFIADEHRPGMRAALEQVVRNGKPTMVEAYTPHTDRWYTTIVGPIFDAGAVCGLSLLTRDVTDARRAEENLRHAQKVETLGTLAGSIAHDINNLLSPILGNSELALRALPPDHSTRPWLEDVVSAARRAKTVVSRILVFGRRAHETRRPVVLPELLREALRFLANSLPSTIEVNVQIEEPCPPVMGLSDQIQQAITNLCANAYQALKATGGRVEVRLAQRELDPSTARSLGMQPGRAVLVSVQDDGPGMAPSLKSRVFEPFFTTKPVGEGSGLGLAIVEAIMRQHGGAVTVESQVGVGTTFQLLFPAHEGPVRNPSTLPTPAVTRRGQRILCVDDEPAVLRMTARMLTSAGFEVSTASTVHEALELIREDPAALDLVVTDETMPKLTGTQLAGRIAELRPDLPVVIVSGYGDDGRSEEEPANVMARLRKPLGIDELVTSLDVVFAELPPR